MHTVLRICDWKKPQTHLAQIPHFIGEILIKDLENLELGGILRDLLVMYRKVHRAESRASGFKAWLFCFTTCVTLGKSLHLSSVQIP